MRQKRPLTAEEYQAIINVMVSRSEAIHILISGLLLGIPQQVRCRLPNGGGTNDNEQRSIVAAYLLSEIGDMPQVLHTLLSNLRFHEACNQSSSVTTLDALLLKVWE